MRVMLRLEAHLLAAARDLGGVLVRDELARVAIGMVGRTQHRHPLRGPHALRKPRWHRRAARAAPRRHPRHLGTAGKHKELEVVDGTLLPHGYIPPHGYMRSQPATHAGPGHIALGRGARADSLQHMGHGMAASDSHTGSAPYPCSGTWPCAPQRCTCPRRPPRCAPRTSRRAPTSSPHPSAARANHPTPARHAAMRTVATQRRPSGCLHATRPAE